LQELQRQASGRTWSFVSGTVAWALLHEDGDAHELLAVWEGNYGTIPADAGAAGVVPGVLSGAKGRERLIIILRSFFLRSFGLRSFRNNFPKRTMVGTSV